MGAICGKIGRKHEKNTPVSDENNSEAMTGTIYMIIIALDYAGTGNELTCTQDGDNLRQLVDQCGVQQQNIIKLYNNDGNKEQVEAAIEEQGGKCQEGDCFFFYYSGHGAEVEDLDGDEADGSDEALCLVTPDGQLDWDMFMTDDEFCQCVTDNVGVGVNIIVMCDCCHSGTIGDFNDEKWAGHSAISLSGCRDSQTSGDTGNGGICTHSLLMAIQQRQQDGEEEYSIGQLYNTILHKDDTVFNSAQDITLNWTDDTDPTSMAWPLVPHGQYTAPWGR